MLKTIESKLIKVSASLPQLPRSVVTWLSVWAWLLALIAGIFSLLAAFQLLAMNSYAAFIGQTLFAIDLGAILTAIYAVIYLSSIPGLRRHHYKGWRLLFIGSVLQLVFGIVIGFLVGAGEIINVLIEVAIGWYLLFQIRPSFTESSSS